MVGCGPGQIFGPPVTEPPWIPPPTDTPTPTDTPRPTITPRPTRTPTPTKAPTDPVPAAPDKSSEYLYGVQVVYIDTFDDPSKGGWSFDSSLSGIKDGAFELPGNNNWNGLERKKKFVTGEGVIVDFSFATGSDFMANMYSGQFNTDSYRQFGVRDNNTQIMKNYWLGTSQLAPTDISGGFVLKPDTPYSLLMAVLPNSGFLIVIWDPSDPAVTIYHRANFGADWADLNRTFQIQANIGIIQVADFREITFKSAKQK